MGTKNKDITVKIRSEHDPDKINVKNCELEGGEKNGRV